VTPGNRDACGASQPHQCFASGAAIEMFAPVPGETADIVAAVENGCQVNIPKLSDRRAGQIPSLGELLGVGAPERAGERRRERDPGEIGKQ